LNLIVTKSDILYKILYYMVMDTTRQRRWGGNYCLVTKCCF